MFSSTSLLVLLLAAAPEQPANGLDLFVEDPSRASQTTDMDRIQCRSDFVPGSRVRTRRICMTRREWERLAVNARDTMYEEIRRLNGIQTRN